MSIDMNRPLAWTKADSEQIKMLQALQGNILKGHGREHTANIFFVLDIAEKLKSRRLLRELANFQLTNAYHQLLSAEEFKATGKDGGPFVHLALSKFGYDAIGETANAPTDPSFQAGMKAQQMRLHDPAVSNWESPFQKDLHGIVLVATNAESTTVDLAATISNRIKAAKGTVVHIQFGKALKNEAGKGIEHFGYVDGRSQPLLLSEDIEDEAAGDGTSQWDPEFGLNAALVKDPGTGDTFSFGSYFVFRKLEQDVRNFKTREQEVASALDLKGEDRERAGALIVGRFEDGTPVTLSDEALGLEPGNNFNYDADPGARCPFHAHIRKVNPRGSSASTGQGKASERSHLMPRRGIPYEDVPRSVHPSRLPATKSFSEFNSKVKKLLPTAGVGLLFMAYNKSIEQQFMVAQANWANDPTFPPVPLGATKFAPVGIDPLIGQENNKSDDHKLLREWDNLNGKLETGGVSVAGFVKMKGGEFLFSPSLTFLRNL